MSRLRELKLTRCTVKSSWLAHITSLPIQLLGLQGTPISDKAIRYILMIPTLDTLEIGDTDVTDEDLKQLSESRSIRHISLSVGKRITNAGIRHISKMTQLVSLELDDSTSVDGRCIAYLTDLKNLNRLNLEGASLTEDDLRHLASFKHLRKLNLSNCQLSDSSLDEVTKVRSLQVLNLAGNNISNKGVSSLSKLTNLIHLTIKACPNVTGNSVRQLQATLPRCTILYSDRNKYAEKMSRPGVKQELQLLENEAENELKKSVAE